MTPALPRQPERQEPLPATLATAAALDDHVDAQAEWGYEAADPALLARLWGEPQLRFDER